MDISNLSDHEVALAARALSIHRVSLRRKLDRLRPNTQEYNSTVIEIGEVQDLTDKLNRADLLRATSAA